MTASCHPKASLTAQPPNVADTLHPQSSVELRRSQPSNHCATPTHTYFGAQRPRQVGTTNLGAAPQGADMALRKKERLYETLGGTSIHPAHNVCRHLRGKPGPTGFGSASTAEQVAAGWDGKGQVVIITGASAGLGAEATRVLANRGATVIMMVRNPAAGKTLANSIKIINPTADVRVILCKLESLRSVADAAAQFLSLKLPLNVLMLNAGIMAPPFGLTEDGIEQQMAVNHVAHVLLTRTLLPTMIQSASKPDARQGRIVVIGSSGHMMAPNYGLRPTTEVNNAKGYTPLAAYGQSKLANILFTRELAARMKAAGITNVVPVTCHPGMVPHTGLSRNLGIRTCIKPMVDAIFRPYMKSIETGCATQVYLATAPQVEAGEYYVDCNFGHSSPASHRKDLGVQSWVWTEEQIAPFLPKNEADPLAMQVGATAPA